MNVKHPPRDFDTLRDEILARHLTLSHRLQQIARFALEHPDAMALQTITMIASRIGVPPSAMIRFAKAFDYRGFSDMQAVFRLPLSESFGGNEHLWLSGKLLREVGQPTDVAVLEESLNADIESLKRLSREMSPERLEQAAELLATRRAVHVIGQRRAFAVAAYLAYALTHLQRPVHLLDGVGGMLFEQASGIAEQDLLIAVSFPPYALKTAELVEGAAAKGAAVIAITDSPMDPIASIATVCLEVHEREVHGLPSLTAALCLSHALAINAGLRREDKRCSQAPLTTGAE